MTELIDNSNNNNKPVQPLSEAKRPQNSAFSNQLQLAQLAHQFALDGRLNSELSKLPLVERAQQHALTISLRQQANLEAIITKAFSYTSNDEINDRVDSDWFFQFTQLAQDISNKTMQDLWAKILAGELQSPCSYSLKALKVFKNMSVADAKLFAKACNISATISDGSKIILTGCYEQANFRNLFQKRFVKIDTFKFGIAYPQILSLASNNLVYKEETELNFNSQTNVFNFILNKQQHSLIAKNNKISITGYKFSLIGTELSRLIHANNEEFAAQCLNTMSQLFYKK
jgi:uncharacterized repeat protein (TIGR03899 family)